MKARQLFSSETPRAPLQKMTLVALVLSLVSAYYIVWVLNGSDWMLWIVTLGALFLWNLLLIYSGKQLRLPLIGSQRDLSAWVLSLVVACSAALLMLGMVLFQAARGDLVYPNPDAISLVVPFLPIVIWVNVQLKKRQ